MFHYLRRNRISIGALLHSSNGGGLHYTPSRGFFWKKKEDKPLPYNTPGNFVMKKRVDSSFRMDIPEDKPVLTFPENSRHVPEGRKKMRLTFYPVFPRKYRSLEMLYREVGITPSKYSELISRERAIRAAKPLPVVTDESKHVIYVPKRPIKPHELRKLQANYKQGIIHKQELRLPVEAARFHFPGTRDVQELPTVQEFRNFFPKNVIRRPIEDVSEEDFDLEWIRDLTNLNQKIRKRSDEWDIWHTHAKHLNIARIPGYHLVRPRLPPPLLSKKERIKFMEREHIRCDIDALMNPLFVMPTPFGWPVELRDTYIDKVNARKQMYEILKNPSKNTPPSDVKSAQDKIDAKIAIGLLKAGTKAKEDASLDADDADIKTRIEPIIKEGVRDQLNLLMRTETKLKPAKTVKKGLVINTEKKTKKKPLLIINADKPVREKRLETDSDSSSDIAIITSNPIEEELSKKILLDTKDIYGLAESSTSSSEDDFVSMISNAAYPYSANKHLPKEAPTPLMRDADEALQEEEAVRRELEVLKSIKRKQEQEQREADMRDMLEQSMNPQNQVYDLTTVPTIISADGDPIHVNPSHAHTIDLEKYFGKDPKFKTLTKLEADKPPKTVDDLQFLPEEVCTPLAVEYRQKKRTEVFLDENGEIPKMYDENGNEVQSPLEYAQTQEYKDSIGLTRGEEAANLYPRLDDLSFKDLPPQERLLAEQTAVDLARAFLIMNRHAGQKIGEYDANQLFYYPYGKMKVFRVHHLFPPASFYHHPNFREYVHWHHWPEYKAEYGDRYPLILDHIRLPSPHVWLARQVLKVARILYKVASFCAALPSHLVNFIDNPKIVVPGLKSTWRAIVHEAKHFGSGFRLLGSEAKTSYRLLKQGITGHNLTRRERKQLIRTSADLLRLVPFIAIVLIPFMELALPLLLKIFPNMLPSTFTDEKQEIAKARANLRAKLFMVDILQDTLESYNQTVELKKRTRNHDISKSIKDKMNQLQESSIPRAMLRFDWNLRRGHILRLPSYNMTVDEAKALIDIIEALPPLEDVTDSDMHGHTHANRRFDANRLAKNVEIHEAFKTVAKPVDDLNSILDSIHRGEKTFSEHEISALTGKYRGDKILNMLSRKYLDVLCTHLKVSNIGTDKIVREKLRDVCEDIRKDDRTVHGETSGDAYLSSEELKEACTERGLRNTGLTYHAYKNNLQKWLDLSVLKHVHPALIILGKLVKLQLDIDISSMVDTKKPISIQSMETPTTPIINDEVTLIPSLLNDLDTIADENELIEIEEHERSTRVREVEVIEKQVLQILTRLETQRREKEGIPMLVSNVPRNDAEILSPFDAHDIAMLTEYLSMLTHGDSLADMKHYFEKLKQDQLEQDATIENLEETKVQVDEDLLEDVEDKNLPLEETFRRKRELRKLRQQQQEDEEELGKVSRFNRSVTDIMNRLEKQLETLSKELPNVKQLDKDNDGVIHISEVKNAILEMNGGHTDVEADILITKLLSLMGRKHKTSFTATDLKFVKNRFASMTEEEKVKYLVEQKPALEKQLESLQALERELTPNTNEQFVVHIKSDKHDR